MVSAILPLRPYQREALNAIKNDLKIEDMWRVAIVLPTGGGKTFCFAHQAKEHLDDHPEDRVVVLVHTNELVNQAVTDLRNIAPHLVIGIVKGARNEVTADVIVASVQSLRSAARRKQLRSVSLIIVDECHHATAPTYRAIIQDLGGYSGKCKVVGYTATMTRGDGGPLGEVWQTVSFTRSISWMVRKQYLIPPRGKSIEVPDLNLAGVKSTKKDYREGELGEALADSLAPQKVAEAIKEHAADRKTIAFFPTVASAYVFAEAIEGIGTEARVVHGGMSDDDRADVLAWHKRGTVLVNCMILTEGYNDPEVDCIVVGRPTKSKGLYIQIVGRGLRVDMSRPYDEQDCLLLDVVGSSRTHNLCSIVDLSEKPIDKEKETEGRTLVELEDEFDAGEGVEEDGPNFYDGEVVTKDFDPLAAGAASRSKVWLKTTEGTYYVPAGTDAYVFIMEYPKTGRWSVAWCTKYAAQRLFECRTPNLRLAEEEAPSRVCRCGKKCPGRAVALTPHRDMDLEVSMSWAEDLAVDMGADTLNLANKKARWRAAQPSEKMVNFAKGLGVRLTVKETDPVTGQVLAYHENGGKVSDAISKIEASRRIDPLVKKAKASIR